MEHEESIKPNSSLSNGQFIVDKLIAKGGFSFIYEGRIIYKLTLANELVAMNTREDPVVIKELYISEKSRRESDGLTLRWNDENEPDEAIRLSSRIKNKTKNEAQKLRLLKSPHILKILGAIEENNTIYQITQKIEGAIDFHKKLNLSTETKGNKLSASAAIRYVTQISQALKEVHSKNIVHLDIKPENILCDYTDSAILIDFGISMTIGEESGRSTILSAASRPWAPPEQYNMKDTNAISFATDIYSLGQTFYAFLTGVIPPDYSNIISGSEILQSPSEYNKEVTDYLDEVVTKCIHVKRDKRYQTIEQFLTALQGESEYKSMIDKAQNAEQNKDYEQAIHILNESEKYIPLSANLLEFRLECQNRLKQQQKEGEFKQKENEAIRLMESGHVEKALSILELLPSNESIQQQIEACKERICLRKKNELIAEAENRISNKQFQEALNRYQEAKKIDQSDILIDKKIEELQTILSDIEKNRKYNQYIQDGDAAFESERFEEALKFYDLAKENTTISSMAIDRKIIECEDKLETIKKIAQEKKKTQQLIGKLSQTRNYNAITAESIDEEIALLKSKISIYADYKKRYPTDTFFDKEINDNKAEEEELIELQIFYKAETAFDNKQYNAAIDLLKTVESSRLTSRADALKNKIHQAIALQKIELARKRVENREYDDALNTLDGVHSEAAEKLKTEIEKRRKAQKDETLIYQAQTLINEGNFEKAKTKLLNVDAQSDQHSQATLLLLEIETEIFNEIFTKAQNAYAAGGYDEAISLLKKIPRQAEHYTQSQNLINQSENKLKEAIYEKMIADVRKLAEAKMYAKAKSDLAKIPQGTTVEPQRQQLLEQLQMSKTYPIKKIVTYMVVGIVAMFVLLFVVGTLISDKQVEPQSPAIDSVPADTQVNTDTKRKEAEDAANREAQAKREREEKERQDAANREAQAKREREEKERQKAEAQKKQSENEQKITNYENQAEHYKNTDNYVAAIQQLQYAQNISYSSSRNTQISNLTNDGEAKARDLMMRAIKLKIDGNLDPCSASLKAYYTKVRKLTTNRQIVGMIKCND